MGKPIGFESYLEARDNDEGYCTHCGEFTVIGCEPDVEEWLCPDCGNRTVYGAEEAMLRGFLEPGDEDDFGE